MFFGATFTKAVGKHAHGLFSLLAVALLSSCGPAVYTPAADIEAHGHVIANVPFIRQPESLCGPAALAGVMQFWGRPASVEEIAKAVYLPQLKGTLPMDMERYAKGQGFRVATPAGTLDAIRAEDKDNRPVICLIDLGFSIVQQPHYVTVIGFDDWQGILIMHDGVTPNRTMTYAAFEKTWKRAGTWMMVMEPETAKEKENLSHN